MIRCASSIVALCCLSLLHVGSAQENLSCVDTAPSGVATTSYVVFEDAASPFCAVCGDGGYLNDSTDELSARFSHSTDELSTRLSRTPRSFVRCVQAERGHMYV